MPFPPAEAAAAAAQQIKPHGNTDYLDNLIADLSTPKEQINRSAPAPGVMAGEPGNLNPAPGNPEDQFYNDPVSLSPEMAAASGQQIAEILDQGISFGAMLYAKGEDAQPYKASEENLNQLSRAWAGVAAKQGWQIEDSPWFKVIFLMITIYYPKLSKAANDRRFKLVNDQIEEIRQQQAADRLRITQMEATKTAA